MNKIFLLLVILIFRLTYSFAQSQFYTDTSVEILPHWQQGESHNIQIKNTVIDSSMGSKPSTSITSFDATFSVLNKDASGYTVQWIYNTASLKSNNYLIEDDVLARLLNKKIVIKLSPTGRFIGLLNFDSLKDITSNIVDSLISENAGNSTAADAQLRVFKHSTTRRQDFEIAFLKQIKFYTLSMGFNYTTQYNQAKIIQLPFIGNHFIRAIEEVRLTNLDTTQHRCSIKTYKTANPDSLKNIVIGLLIKSYPQDSISVKNGLSKASFKYVETSQQQIDFLKGIPLMSIFTKDISDQIQKLKLILEIKTID